MRCVLFMSYINALGYKDLRVYKSIKLFSDTDYKIEKDTRICTSKIQFDSRYISEL